MEEITVAANQLCQKEKEAAPKLTTLQEKGLEPIKGEDGIYRNNEGNFWNEFNQLRYENLELKRKLQEFEDYQKLEHQSTREDIKGALVIIREIKALLKEES